MVDNDDSHDGRLRQGVRSEARERSLRFLDFPEAYYSMGYPPIHDIGAYRDVQIRQVDLPGESSASLTSAEDRWLLADLAELGRRADHYSTR